jgi:hypothetical protein
MAIETVGPVLGSSTNGEAETIPPTSELRAEAVAELMKEYDQKLRNFLGRFRTIESERKQLCVKKDRESADRIAELVQEREEIIDSVHRLLFPAEELARHASAIAEHARVDRVTQLELRLRAAEFETAIERTRFEVH